MNTKKRDFVRVGVVGTGRMGQRHCRVLSNLRKSELVGVCDHDQAVGANVAQQFDTAYFSDVEQLLPLVDAVVLAVPTPLHFDLATRCLEQNVHLMIEKPICQTIDEAQNLVKTAEEKNLIVQVGHIERFNPAYMELVNLLSELEPLVITAYRLSPFLGSNTDVDVVMDLMIHDVNLILDMVNCKPDTIQAQGLTAFSGTIDHANVQMSFCDSALVNMTSSRVTEHKVRRVEITCREAFIECDLLNKSISIHRSTIGEYVNSIKRSVKYRQESIVERISIPAFEPLFLELQHFIDCILEGNTPYVTALDGLEALQLSTQISDMIHRNMLNMDRRKK